MFFAKFAENKTKDMITYNQWKKDAESPVDKSCRIGNDLFLIKRANLIQVEIGPFLSDMIIAIILKTGHMHISIDMEEYKAEAPCMITILPKQIFKIIETSEIIDADTVLMSQALSDTLFNEYASFNQLHKTVITNPITKLSKEVQGAFDLYVNLLENLIGSPLQNYKLEAAKHLTLSMFYGVVFSIHDMNEIAPADRQTILFRQFSTELKRHYKKEREVTFYADKLCITPKYLSAIVLEHTGKSAIKCINEYVANECQALLLSTDLTLQQISDKLHFPSPSVFSKFFKRMTGLSPRDYRKQTL